jgi:hypothetical protein
LHTQASYQYLCLCQSCSIWSSSGRCPLPFTYAFRSHGCDTACMEAYGLAQRGLSAGSLELGGSSTIPRSVQSDTGGSRTTRLSRSLSESPDQIGMVHRRAKDKRRIPRRSGFTPNSGLRQHFITSSRASHVRLHSDRTPVIRHSNSRKVSEDLFCGHWTLRHLELRLQG